MGTANGANRRRITIEYIREYLSREGYLLLSTRYRSREKVEAVCPNNHRYRFNWYNFASGRRCSRCKRSLSQEHINAALQKEGYTLLSNYKNHKTILTALCPNRHIYKFRWTYFQQGYRCKKCYDLKRVPTTRSIRQWAQKYGYELLSTTYYNAHQKLDFKCSRQHKCRISWNKFYGGHRCNICSRIQAANNRKNTFEEIKERIEQEGYQLISSVYEGALQKLEAICCEGHRHTFSWTSFQQGSRCPYCLHKSEHKLGEILEQIYPGRIKKQGNLGFLGRQRVDYYLEEEKIAIEYDGEQHHKPIIGAFGAKTEEEAQEQLREIRERDKRKERLCKENEWKLIRVRYDEPLVVGHIRDRVDKIIELAPYCL